MFNVAAAHGEEDGRDVDHRGVALVDARDGHAARGQEEDAQEQDDHQPVMGRRAAQL